VLDAILSQAPWRYFASRPACRIAATGRTGRAESRFAPIRWGDLLLRVSAVCQVALRPVSGHGSKPLACCGSFHPLLMAHLRLAEVSARIIAGWSRSK